MSQEGHSEQLLFFALFYQSTPSCLKVIGGVECAGGHVVMCRRPCGDVQAAMWWVAHVILVSAQVLLILTLGLWT